MVGVTGLGSLPGTDLAAGARLAVEATPDLPWLPEFPARGPWAGIIGRGAALLEGLDAGLDAGEWKLAPVAGIDLRRGRAALRDDLDVFEEAAHGWAGPVKVSVTGPWTLASSLMLPLGGRVLGDRAARRDVTQALVAGVSGLVAEVARRLPGAAVRVQVDEPSLPAVLAGRVPTEGGYFRHRAVDLPEVADALAGFAGLTEDALLHCCAPDVPVELVLDEGRHGAGFAGVSLDGTLLDQTALDALGPRIEAGRTLYLGVVRVGGASAGPDPLVRRAIGLLRPLELGGRLADRLWLTPACGLAGEAVGDVPRVFDVLARAATLVDEALRAG